MTNGQVRDTLDGMSVEQLRELAKRAEAAAKVREEANRIVIKPRDSYGGDISWAPGGAIMYGSGATVKSVVGEWSANTLVESLTPSNEASRVVDLLAERLRRIRDGK